MGAVVADGAAVRVSVPATSANLGPGFDALGLALDLRDTVEAQRLRDADDVLVEVNGEGAGGVPLDDRHLVVRSMRAAFERMGCAAPGVRLRCSNVVPHGRGLGSSAAAIVAGVWAARALIEGGDEVLDDAAALALAADLEGHPDNVAPAAIGGFVISGRGADGEWYAVRSRLAPDLAVRVFVPPEPLSTAVARGLLPASVGHASAAANGGRAALLVAALAGPSDHLLEATRDWLHQDQRAPAMPASLALMHRLRDDGVAAVVSGAGPTVLALLPGGAEPPDLSGECPPGWTTMLLAPALEGVQVLRD